jgi:hypothetical protein
MVTDYQREMYGILSKAAQECEAVHLSGVLWDASGPAGERVAEAELRADNFRMMLAQLIRAVESGKGVADKIEKAKGLLSRLSRPTDILR